MRQELTDQGLRNLAPATPGARYELADGHVVGLRVRVGDKMGERSRATAITFVLLARFGGSACNPTRRTLGRFPPLGLSEARQKAIAWKQMLERGIDPANQVEGGHRRKRDLAPTADLTPASLSIETGKANSPAEIETFDQLADEFLRLHVDKVGLRTTRAGPLSWHRRSSAT